MGEKVKVASIYRGFDLLSLGVGLLIGCFLVYLTYVTVYKSDMLAFPMSMCSYSISFVCVCVFVFCLLLSDR